MSRPWWLQLEGGDEAAERVRNLDTSPILQSAWIIQNETRLGRDPEIAAAAVASGMPGPYIKRLDNAIQNAKKAKQYASLSEIHAPTYVRDTTVKAGNDATRAFLRAARERQATQDATQAGMLTDFSAAGDLETLQQQRAFETREEEESNEPWWSQAAHGVWDAGKSAWSGLLTGLDALGGTLNAPIAAGQSARDNREFGNLDLADTATAFGANPVRGIGEAAGPSILESGKDLLSGVGALFGFADLDARQKQDMIAGGYDPDSFTDRWGWYTDLNSPHEVVSNETVKRLKQQHNPYKVDMVRQIVASGALTDESYVDALDPQAQKMFRNIQRNEDKEAASIAETLHGEWMSPGRNLIHSVHGGLSKYGVETDLDSEMYKGLQVAGDLAFYWFLDPGVGLGKAAKVWRDRRWAVQATPDAVKDFIINSKVGSKRWDEALDMVDQAHVLTRRATPESLVKAARVGDEFRRKYADMSPMYEHLLQLRSGAVTGTVFRTDMDKAVGKGKGDWLSNAIEIKRVDDMAKRKPVFALRNAPDEEVSQAARDLARREVADRLGDAVFAMAVVKGDPLLTKGKMLVPGMYRMSLPLRNMMKPFTDRAFSREGLLFKQLDDAKGKGVIDFGALGPGNLEDALGGVIDSAQGGKFIRDTYTRGGLRSKIARATKNFGMFEDSAILRLEGVDTTKQYYEFVRKFLPRGQAAFLAHRWAVADPGTRSVMKERMFEMLGDALGIRDTKVSRDLWDRLMHNLSEAPESFTGRRPSQIYAASAVNEIDTPYGKMPAAMYSTQFADGFQLPSMLEMARTTERGGILSMIFGVNHGRFADQIDRAHRGVVKASRVIRSGWIGTLSNLLRQRIEGRELLQLLDNPGGYVRTTLARAGVAGHAAETRAAVNSAVRQAKKLESRGQWKTLASYHARGNTDEYVAEAERMLGEELHPWLRSALLDNAPIPEIAAQRGSARLLATGVFVDPLRKVRAARYKKLGEEYNALKPTPWAKEVDTRFAEDLAANVRTTIGHDRDHYIDGAMADEVQQIDDILHSGDKVTSTRLTNQWDYLDALGDSGVQRWHTAKAFMDHDPIGSKVSQAVASELLNVIRHGKGAPARWLNNLKIQLREQYPNLRQDIARIGTPEDYAFFLLKHTPEGVPFRTNGRRAMMQNGNHLPRVEDRDGALREWADAMVKDITHKFGLLDTNGALNAAISRGQAPESVLNMLAKHADGKVPSLKDLRAIPEEFRPFEVEARVIVGKRAVDTGGAMDKLGGLTAKWYRSVVARPLHNMVSSPVMLAAHREVMDAMEPVARRLMDQGMSAQSAYNHMQNLAWGHALARNYRYMDNPKQQSYFAALFNNYLWFERATEDFLRRAMRVTKADPAILARHALMVEAGVHSGLIHEARVDDGEGGSETELIFQWPGSGLAMRAINEALGALGIQDRVVVPVWQDLRSPVRYLSPSLQNPIGFTTSPLIGLPIRFMRDNLFPEAAPQLDSLLSSMEGGERYFASQDGLQSLLPAYGRRLLSLFDRDSQQSQWQSAVTNALIQYHAAGKLPGKDATPSERAQALDDIRTMTTNNLLFRTLFAAWAPSAPQTIYSNVNDIGDEDLSVVDRIRGIDSVRGSWFALLEDMTTKYGPERGYSEASAEWFKRGNKSIVNPEAYLAGSTGEPGGLGSFASGMQTAQWMIKNRGFLKEYSAAAYALLPSFNEPYFDAIGYRLQLRNELRERKTPDEMYDSLLFSSGERDFYHLLSIRDKAIKRGANEELAKDWFEQKVNSLKGSNPVWADLKNEYSSPTYIARNVAPHVRKLANAKPESLPEEVRKHQDQIELLAKLYDEYQSEVQRATSSQARIGLAIRYGQIGDELFENGPLNDLWKRMRVWED